MELTQIESVLCGSTTTSTILPEQQVQFCFFFTNTNVKFYDIESIAKEKWQDLHSFVGRILICNCQQRNVWATYEQQYTKQAPTTSYYTFGQIIQVFQSKLFTIDN